MFLIAIYIALGLTMTFVEVGLEELELYGFWIIRTFGVFFTLIGVYLIYHFKSFLNTK